MFSVNSWHLFTTSGFPVLMIFLLIFIYDDDLQVLWNISNIIHWFVIECVMKNLLPYLILAGCKSIVTNSHTFLHDMFWLRFSVILRGNADICQQNLTTSFSVEILTILGLLTNLSPGKFDKSLISWSITEAYPSKKLIATASLTFCYSKIM